MTILKKVWPRFWRDLTLTVIPGSILMPQPLRPKWLNWFGANVHARAAIASGVVVSDKNFSAGPRTFVNRGTFIDASARVELGSDVAIGMGVHLITSTHRLGDSGRRAGEADSARISVGDGTWIGAGSIVLPGVVIGRGCVIAAGSVVTKDCAPDTLYAGTPARAIRALTKTDGSPECVAR